MCEPGLVIQFTTKKCQQVNKASKFSSDEREIREEEQTGGTYQYISNRNIATKEWSLSLFKADEAACLLPHYYHHDLYRR